MSRSYLSCLKNISSYIPYDGIASIIVPIINIDAPFFSSSSSSKKIRLFVTRGKFSSRKFIAIFRFLSPIISSISKIDYIIFQYPVNCVTGKLFLRFFQKKKKIKQVSYNLAFQLTNLGWPDIFEIQINLKKWRRIIFDQFLLISERDSNSKISRYLF